MRCLLEFIQWKKVLVRACHLLLVFGVAASLIFQPSGKNLVFVKSPETIASDGHRPSSFRSPHGFIWTTELFLLYCLRNSRLCLYILLLHDLLYWPRLCALPKSTTDLCRDRWWWSVFAIRVGTELDRRNGLDIRRWRWCCSTGATDNND